MRCQGCAERLIDKRPGRAYLASLAERIEPKAPLAANVMRSGRHIEQAVCGHAGTYSFEERPSGPTRQTAAFMQPKLAYRSD